MARNQIKSNRKSAIKSSALCALQSLEGRMLMASDPLTVTLSKGALTITGSKNNDTIVVDWTGSAWTISNGSWSTTKTGTATKLTVNGKLGNDSIKINSSVLIGGMLIGDAGNDTLLGGSYNDTLQGGAGSDEITGGSGNDVVDYSDHAATAPVTITLGADGTGGATGENDVLTGDIEGVIGSKGADHLNTGSSGASLWGGAGNDTLQGSLGNDFINGDAGDDSLSGSLGNDTMNGGLGNDNISGSIGNDLIHGDAGNDTINGSLDNDALYGDAGNDSIDGSIGNDSLYGGAGNDSMDGNIGNDLLISIGGGKLDIVNGGLDSDVFWTDTGANETTDADSDEIAAGQLHRVSSFANKASIEIAGQNLADPAVTSKSIKYRNFKNNPIFSSSGPSIDDIKQGSVGDCYFLAQLGSLAKLDANLIRQSIVNLGDGTFAIQLVKGGSQAFYRIDGDLPAYSDSALVYAGLGKESSTWVALYEKAWAFARKAKNSYASIASGFMTEVASAFGKSNTWGWATANGVLATLQSELAAGRSVTAGTNASQPGDSLLVGSHAYAIISITGDAGSGYSITVRNPWGVDGYSSADGSQDGYVTITGAQFSSWINAYAVCDA